MSPLQQLVMADRLVIADGGRKAAGFSEARGDCVARAIAIATELPYAKVHSELRALCMIFAGDRRFMRRRRKRDDPDDGISPIVWQIYLSQLGWSWTSVEQKLRHWDLPRGRLIVMVPRHAMAVIDHVVFDAYDSWRARRFVRGYWWHK
jgi:hypothetical protein